MCELCKLEQAQDRESLAAAGSALASNDRVARSNNESLDLHGVTAINLLSTPRAGKTSLLESCIPTLQRDYRIGIVTSDLAIRARHQGMRALGVPTLQVVTGSGRHLDAHLLQRALHDIVTHATRSVVHRERRQSRMPGEPESRPASQRRAGVRAGRRRSAAARAGDLPRSRPGAADQDRPAGAHAGFDDLCLHQNLRAIGCEAPVLGSVQPARYRHRRVLRMAAREGSAAVAAGRIAHARSRNRSPTSRECATTESAAGMRASC